MSDEAAIDDHPDVSWTTAECHHILYRVRPGAIDHAADTALHWYANRGHQQAAKKGARTQFPPSGDPLNSIDRTTRAMSRRRSAGIAELSAGYMPASRRRRASPTCFKPFVCVLKLAEVLPLRRLRLRCCWLGLFGLSDDAGFREVVPD